MKLVELAAVTTGFEEKKLAEFYSPVFLLRQQKASAPVGADDATLFEQLTGKEEGIEARVTDFHVFPVRSAGAKPFGSEYISLGRGEGNDIVVDDGSVSKFHAFIVLKGDAFALADAGSKNGTYVNDVRVANYRDGKPAALEPGDRVRCGDVRLTFVKADAVFELCKRVR